MEGGRRQRRVLEIQTNQTGRDGTVVEARDSPLPLVLRLGSDAGDDVTSWYAETFSNELSEVKKSIKLASDRVKNLHQHTPSIDEDGERDSTQLSEGDLDDHESSASSNMATKLEIALMQAKEEAESQSQQKIHLETRLACLEEMEELRMKISTFELHELLEQKSEESASAGNPQWDRDELHKDCFRCSQTFSFSVRRHHCRKCGHIYCEKCAPRSNVSPIPAFGYFTPVRHCFNCLPPSSNEKQDQLTPGQTTVSGSAKQPLTSAIDGIRRLETACLKHPSAESLLVTLESYVGAIEKVSKSPILTDNQFRKSAHAVLLRSMRAFLQMPQAQACLREAPTSERAHIVISSITCTSP